MEMETKFKEFLISKVESPEERAQMIEKGIFVNLPQKPMGGKTSLISFAVYSEWKERKNNPSEYHVVSLTQVKPNKLYNYLVEQINNGRIRFKLA